MDRSIGDFLPLECAEILFNMSFFLLKSPLSEQSRFVSSSSCYATSNTCIYNILAVAIHGTCLIVFRFVVLFCRDICCIFSSVTMADVVPWLLKAFVLSRESPSLVQEVRYVMLSCAIVLWTIYNV
jgi:separase